MLKKRSGLKSRLQIRGGRKEGEKVCELRVKLGGRSEEKGKRIRLKEEGTLFLAGGSRWGPI